MWELQQHQMRTYDMYIYKSKGRRGVSGKPMSGSKPAGGDLYERSVVSYASTVVPNEYKESVGIVNANAAESLINAHAVWVCTHGAVM